MKNLTLYLLSLVVLAGCTKEDEILQPDVNSTIESRASGPTVTTNATTYITSLTGTSGGNVSSSGGGNNTTEKGVCYATHTNPTTADPKVVSGSGSGPFVSILSGLNGSTLYYIRAYAIKSGVTYYGNQVSFTTLVDYGPVTDFDGNTYGTINIGGQVWMRENLKTTHFQDGTSVPLVSDDADWFSLSTGGYCMYNNDPAYAAIYGFLYNWYAATDVHNIAPTGYHVPSNDEWTTLKNYLGGSNVAGGRAKETGLSHWHTPNTGATNSSGFLSIPGGARYVNASPLSPVTFSGQSYYSDWWTTSITGISALFVETSYNSEIMYRDGFLGGVGYYDPRTGYAIRCVKN